MASPTIERHRSIANGSDGDVRLATETIAEIMKYREALFRAAPSHQGGHSDTGAAIEGIGEFRAFRMPPSRSLLWREGGMSDLFLERDAVISDCGKYRYLLRRTWDAHRPRALYVMLNPSTADADIDDATIRSCIRLAKGLGYGSFEVVNLFAFRATDPANLEKADEPVGPSNDASIERAVGRCDLAICAWGAHPMADRRANRVREMIRLHRPAVFCFGKTKAGAPKHPLYIKSGTPLETYGF